MNRDRIHDVVVFASLVAIGVVGRWAQPMWNFTPLAAITALGGFYFSRTSITLMVPVSALLLSHLLLPAYGNWLVLASVLAMVLLPVALGRVLRRTSGSSRVLIVAMCGVGPATAFYGVTNFLVWMTTGLYEHSLSGLLACYSAAIPYYRAMLLGDMLYVTLFAAIACFQFQMRPAYSRRMQEVAK